MYTQLTWNNMMIELSKINVNLIQSVFNLNCKRIFFLHQLYHHIHCIAVQSGKKNIIPEKSVLNLIGKLNYVPSQCDFCICSFDMTHTFVWNIAKNYHISRKKSIWRVFPITHIFYSALLNRYRNQSTQFQLVI